MGGSLGAWERSLPGARRAVRRLVWRLTTSSVARTVGASIVGQLALAVSGICSARALGVENRGHLALLMLVPLILVQLGGMGVPAAVTFFTARAGTVQAIPRRLFGLVAGQAVAVFVTAGIVIAALGAGDDSSVRVAGVFVMLAAPGSLLTQYGLAVLQGQSRFAAFNVLRNLPALLYALVAVVLFVRGVDSLVAFALVWSLTWPASTVATVVVARRVPERPAARGGVRGLIGFGLRALPGTSSPLETFRLDQAVVGLFLSVVDLGLYVVAAAFTVLPRLLSLSVGAVAYPRLASMRDDVARRALGRRAILLSAGLCAGVVIPLIAGASFLVEFIFGKEFADAAAATRILLVGALFASIRRIVGDVARGVGRPGVGSLGELASWVCAVPLVAILLPAYELEGVALALTFSAGVGLIVGLSAYAGKPWARDRV